MRLGLFGQRGARDADLALHGREALAGEFAEGVRNARRAHALGGLSTELLDARRHAALVITRLLEVLLEPLLVGGLLGEADVRRQVRWTMVPPPLPIPSSPQAVPVSRASANLRRHGVQRPSSR